MTGQPHKPQQEAWDREYRDPRLLSRKDVPHADVVRFVKWIKKEWRKEEARTGVERMSTYESTTLDLGSGTGRNALYLAERGSKVIGYEISPKAIEIAKGFAADAGLPIVFERRSIGAVYPLADASVDIVLDVTSSNSLDEAGREVYLRESSRVLKPGGFMLVRALAKDADDNAKALIERFPGAEKDTYVLPEVGVTERVFTKADFLAAYEPYFEVAELERSTHYARMSGKSYKRNYWIAYLRKPFSKDE